MKLGIIAIADEGSSGLSVGSSALFFDEMPASPPPRGDVKDLGRVSGVFGRPLPRDLRRPSATKTSRRRP